MNASVLKLRATIEAEREVRPPGRAIGPPSASRVARVLRRGFKS
jgi:hypothetical protein